MKRKTPFTSSVKSKSNSESTRHIEDSSSDDQSSKQVLENKLDKQSNEEKVEGKQTIWNQITREQFISAVKELGSDKKQLDKETWRFNYFTLSKESIWGRLISKLKLNETENIRQSLYNVWRRHRPKIEDEISEKRVDSVEEDNKTDKRNKVELSLSNPETTCKSPSCERTFEIFIRDEPIGRDSIVVRIRAVGDENHSADEKAVARHLTGKDRLEVGNAANTIGCLKVFQQKIENA
ncbi:unnamed protein product, partial [Didymodactylos carnosus]